MELVHEFTWQVSATLPKTVGQVPWGTRMFHQLPEVKLAGPRLNARSLVPGGDWILATDDGWSHIDVRAQLEADDGASIYVQYEGWIEPTEKLMAAVQALVPTDFGDQSIRTVWKFESGDAKHAWLNRSVFVGEGRLLPGGPGLLGMEHKIFRVA